MWHLSIQKVQLHLLGKKQPNLKEVLINLVVLLILLILLNLLVLFHHIYPVVLGNQGVHMVLEVHMVLVLVGDPVDELEMLVLVDLVDLVVLVDLEALLDHFAHSNQQVLLHQLDLQDLLDQVLHFVHVIHWNHNYYMIHSCLN